MPSSESLELGSAGSGSGDGACGGLGNLGADPGNSLGDGGGGDGDGDGDGDGGGGDPACCLC